MSVAYDPSTMIRNGMDGATQQAAQESGFAIGASQDGLTEADREEKKKKDEEFHEALSGAMEEQRKKLSEQQKEILRGQEIDLGNGKKASALDIVNAMDKLLDNWDDSFDDMVTQGVAKPGDKNKLYKSALRYRNMMADTNLSAQQKQQLRDQMIQNGDLTQEQMTYFDEQATLGKNARSAEIKADGIDRTASTQTSISALEGQKAFADNPQLNPEQVAYLEKQEKSENAGDDHSTTLASESSNQLFSMSSPSGIQSNVNLTEAYNANASRTNVTEMRAANQTPPAPTVATATISPDAAFG
jgi:hypothetical protein